MRHKVTLIPGEGIGPEVAAATKRVIDAAGVQIEWEELEARTDSATEAGQLVNQGAIASVRRNRVALKGPTGTAIAGGAPSVNVALRKTLDLYANLRPVKNLPGVKSRFENVDLVLVRENTEDLYSGLEHEVVPGVVESLKIITERASTRIARFAFEYAKRSSRKKIHAIHKANIMKLSDGLFLKSVRAVAERYKDVEYKELIVDNACMQMVLDPQQFDMLLLPNLYGDVMSDLAAGLVGGLGVVPSGNIGDECAMFEAGTRHRARHRRQRPRKSHRAANERNNDARSSRRAPSRPPHRSSLRKGLSRRQARHPRPRRQSNNTRIHRRRNLRPASSCHSVIQTEAYARPLQDVATFL